MPIKKHTLKRGDLVRLRTGWPEHWRYGIVLRVNNHNPEWPHCDIHFFQTPTSESKQSNINQYLTGLEKINEQHI